MSNKINRLGLIKLSLAGLCFAVGASALAKGGNVPSPNIIHIIADDVGYDDLSCYGAKDIKTPNLDRLGARGITFTDFYAPHPTCTPSRAAILTGRYASRVNDGAGLSILWPGTQDGLDPDQEICLAKILKQQGYTTSLVGKWHLGDLDKYLPLQHGFDEYFGIPHPNDHGPERDGNTGSKGCLVIPLYRGNEVVERLDNNALSEVPGRFVREVCGFIRRQAESGKPFYLQYSNIETHTPWFVPKGFEGQSEAGPYGDAVEYMDRSIGIILGQLRTSGLEKNTLVVFTSDNGPLAHAYPELEDCYGKYAQVDVPRANARLLQDGKYQARYEGGCRVACIMKWPDRIPAGVVDHNIVDGTDLFTTFIELAGAKVPEDRVIDGQNIWHLMSGTSAEPVRDVFFSWVPKRNLMGVRKGKWKLLVPGKGNWAIGPQRKPALFDLEKDPGEKTDLSAERPEVVQELLDLVRQARKDLEKNRPFTRF